MIDKKATIKRVFTINYKVKDFSDINDDIDLLILGIANVRDNDGKTALIHASYKNHLKVVQILIDAGADVDIQDNDGRTALMWASSNDNLEVVQELIKAGADVNIQNNEGWTALIYAKIYKNQEIIDLLKKAGAK